MGYRLSYPLADPRKIQNSDLNAGIGRLVLPISNACHQLQINRRNSNPEAQCVVELDWRLIPSRTAYQSPQPPKQTEIPDAHLIAA
jgi:hypothetical protein